MTNQELSTGFKAKVPANHSLDYFDRFVDLAVYLNETLADSQQKDSLITAIKDEMIKAYELRGN